MSFFVRPFDDDGWKFCLLFRETFEMQSGVEMMAQQSINGVKLGDDVLRTWDPCALGNSHFVGLATFSNTTFNIGDLLLIVSSFVGWDSLISNLETYYPAVR